MRYILLCISGPAEAGNYVAWHYKAAVDPSRAGRPLSRGVTMMTFTLD